jgi:hypothetical protein
MPVEIKILDPQGQTVYEGKAEVRRNTPTRTIEQQLPEIEIPQPQLWDTEHPNLYRAIVTLHRENGSVADVACSSFGIRTIEIGSDFGFKLNGKHKLVKANGNLVVEREIKAGSEQETARDLLSIANQTIIIEDAKNRNEEFVGDMDTVAEPQEESAGFDFAA